MVDTPSVVVCAQCEVHWYVADQAPKCAATDHDHQRFDLHLHRSVVVLLDGIEVTAVSFDARDPYARDRDPDFGLYLDAQWDPPWPHDHIDWPDFGIPSERGQARPAGIGTSGCHDCSSGIPPTWPPDDGCGPRAGPSQSVPGRSPTPWRLSCSRVIVWGVAKPHDWEALLVKGYEPLKVAQRIFRWLPHDPRCKLCLNPFGGVGGKMIGLLGHKPSRKNPNICQYCFDRLPTGGIEIDIGVVFADVRASTALGEQSDATTFAERLNEFYGTATKVLIHNEGIVDKLIGDEVMGLFIQGIAGPEYRRKAAIAALELASQVAELPLGVAANAGVAFVGNVGSGSVLDFTALGDAVNVGARLQAHASPGEVVLAASLYPLIEAEYPGGRPDRVAIRGRDQQVDVVVLTSPG